MKLDKGNIKSIRHLILFAAAVCLGVMYIKEVLAAIGLVLGIAQPFLWGAAIAFILNIPLHSIEEKLLKKWTGKWADKLKRPISILLSILFVIAILVFVIMTVVPQLGRTIIEIGNKLPVFFNNVLIWSEEVFASNPQIVEYLENLQLSEFDWEGILNKVVGFLQSGVGSMLTSTFSVASSIIGGVANVFIAFIFAIYVLTQKEKLKDQAQRLVKAYCSEKVNVRVTKVVRLLSSNFSHFVSGQCTEAVILGVMFVVVLSIFRIPYAILIGVLIGFTALIPVVGAFIGCGVGAFLILVEDPMQAVIFVIIFLVLQQIEGNLIYPRVVGNSVGLPSMWVLAAVTVGGSLMGVVGMLVFIPLASTVYMLVRDDVNARNTAKALKPREEKLDEEAVDMEQTGQRHGQDAQEENAPCAEAENETKKENKRTPASQKSRRTKRRR